MSLTQTSKGKVQQVTVSTLLAGHGTLVLDSTQSTSSLDWLLTAEQQMRKLARIIPASTDTKLCVQIKLQSHISGLSYTLHNMMYA